MITQLALRVGVAACLCLGLLLTPATAQTQSRQMPTDPETGLIIKVVAGSNKIKAESAPGKGDVAYELELLQPYYVVEERGDHYKITNVPANSLAEAEGGKIGYVRKDQVIVWPTREALHFLPFTMSEGRNAIQAWDDENTIKKFLSSGDNRTYKPTFEEDIKSSLAREKTLRPYPVVKSFDADFLGRSKKRVYEVLLPAAIPAGTAGPSVQVKTGDLPALEKALRSVTFAIVFDATGSMGPYAKEVAAEINGALRQLEKEQFDDVRVGFVFFRDEGDAEPSLIVPAKKVDEATAFLDSYASKMGGGGDPSEPVLDAMYIANHLFDWDAGTAQRGAKKIMITVLNDDAKPRTTGKIDPRVPEGLSPQQIAEELLKNGITAITLQAGPASGANLVPVLKRIADVTKGRFIEATGKFGAQLGVAVKESVIIGAKVARDEGKTIATETKVGPGGLAVIPLKVLDGEKLDRLRRAGVKFNIEDMSGGILVDRGFLPENNDLLDPQIKIEKDTLQRLVNLFSVLSNTTIDARDLRQSTQDSIAAIAGEKPDPKEDIAKIIKKRLGIQFRTELLSFPIDYLEGLTPKEKLALQKRIKEQADRLGDFMEANLKDFDTLGAVWMPVTHLP